VSEGVVCLVPPRPPGGMGGGEEGAPFDEKEIFRDMLNTIFKRSLSVLETIFRILSVRPRGVQEKNKMAAAIYISDHVYNIEFFPRRSEFCVSVCMCVCLAVVVCHACIFYEREKGGEGGGQKNYILRPSSRYHIQ
jgi:hypothetical protein